MQQGPAGLLAVWNGVGQDADGGTEFARIPEHLPTISRYDHIELGVEHCSQSVQGIPIVVSNYNHRASFHGKARRKPCAIEQERTKASA